MKNSSSTTYIFVVDIMRLIRAIVPEKEMLWLNTNRRKLFPAAQTGFYFLKSRHLFEIQEHFKEKQYSITNDF